MANGLEMMLSTEVELLQAENARLMEELAAARQGMTAAQLSAIEHGRTPSNAEGQQEAREGRSAAPEC